MKAKDLRIGNLVNSNKGEPCNVATIEGFAVGRIGLTDIPHGYYFDDIITAISPILITKEWLVKLGFELVGKQYEAQEFDVYKNGYFTWNSNHGWWFCNINIQNKAKVEYVHELQNLYFALTKTELVLAVAGSDLKPNSSGGILPFRSRLMVVRIITDKT